MERDPQQSLSRICIGHIYDRTHRKDCAECQFRTECDVLLGRHAHYTDVENLASIAPEIPAARASAMAVSSVYADCYRAVYGDGIPRSIRTSECAAVVNRARESGTSVKMYVLANMHGFSVTNPGRKFSPAVMITDHGVRRAETYKKAVISRFGTFDPDSLGMCVGSRMTVEDRIADSETLAARWISGYTLVHTGNPYRAFFNACSTRLDPYWLATCPEYDDCVDAGTLTRVQSNVFEDVSVAREYLARHGDRAAFIVKARATAATKLVPDILSRNGVMAGLVFDPGTRSSLEFWAGLGVVIQHILCWHAYHSRDLGVLTRLNHGQY